MRFERSGRGGQTSGQSSLCGCRILSYPAATAKSKPPCAVGMAPAALVEVLHLLLHSLFLLTFPLTVSRGMHRFCTHLSACVQQRPAHHRACRLGKRLPHFLFQLPDSIGQAGLRNIELLHCMADGAGAGNSRDIAELLKGHGCCLSACFSILPQSRQKRNVFSSLKYQTNIAGISKIRFTRPAISLIIAPQS